MQNNWRKSRTFIIEHHLWATVLWRKLEELKQYAEETGTTPQVSQASLAHALGKSTSTVQSALTGKTILTVNRAMRLASHLDVTPEELIQTREDLLKRLKRVHKGLEIIYEFPRKAPSQDERILRSFQIEDHIDGLPWAHVFAPDVIEPDDIWRARQRKGWSRREAAEAFGCVPGTVYHWERVNLPDRRRDQARQVYGSLLG